MKPACESTFRKREKMKRNAILLLVMSALAFGSAAWAQPVVETKSLKLGILPDADSLPFLVCEAENLFAKQNISVTLVRFQNPVERDAAFQAGAVDGVVGDTIAALLDVQGGFPVKITSLTDGRYGIAVSPDSGIKSVKDLAGKPIGISSNTIIHYMVDTFMADAGVPESKINVVPVPKMPVRLELMLAGQTAAAGLPEPLLTTARLRGASIIASTDDKGLGAGVLLFSASALNVKLDSISSLYKAYWTAVQEIDANPDAYRSILSSQAGFSQEAAKVWRFVTYKKPRLPSIEDITSVIAWMKHKGLLKINIDPASLLEGRPLEGW
jgi:NitT/TauT family transport system substrate-binding protein